MEQAQRIMVTGATGFVGSHVHARLLALGHDVVGATRHPDRARRTYPERTFVALDVADESSTQAALAGFDAALYLIHSMADSDDFEQLEERAARSFAKAAAAAEVGRIVYLGGVQ